MLPWIFLCSSPNIQIWVSFRAYLGMQLLSHRTLTPSSYLEMPTYFPKCLYQFIFILLGDISILISPHPCPKPVSSDLLVNANIMGIKWYFVAFFWNTPDTSWHMHSLFPHLFEVSVCVTFSVRHSLTAQFKIAACRYFYLPHLFFTIAVITLLHCYGLNHVPPPQSNLFIL